MIQIINIKHYWISIGLLLFSLPAVPAWSQLTTVEALVEAVNNGAAGDEVQLAAGTFELTQPLQPKSGMTIRGAGRGKTIIQGSASWTPGTADLPDREVDHKSVNRQAYLFDLGDNTYSVTISDLTLKGPNLHGAVQGNDCDGLELYNLEFNDFLWCSVRTFRMGEARIHDNLFVDAGGKYERKTGGALFMTWVVDSEFWNNTVMKSEDQARIFFGFRTRKARNCRFHHNTILVNFSIELSHENDQFITIDHNYLEGTISVPKFGGGTFPEDENNFRIHHNYFTRSYALEWARNGVEIDHNLFDFDTDQDFGNLITNFGAETAQGYTRFHDNLVKNPGRGLFWSRGVYNNYSFYNNHVIANKTVTPREDGLFGFNSQNDFETITIRDNIIECVDLSRPLMRNSESYGAVIENNTLVNISDTDAFANPSTGEPRGPLAPLSFTCGANEQYRVEQWTISESAPSEQTLLTIYAAGRTNTETMELRIDGQAVKSWTNVGGNANARSFVAYEYEVDGTVSASQVRVAFTNDDQANRDLRIDKIEVDGVAYPSEAPTTYSTGTWTADNGCDEDYKQSEWLHCNGYLAYDQTNVRTTEAEQKQPPLLSSEVKLFPNPAQDVVRVQVPPSEGPVVVTLSDGLGREILLRRQAGTHDIDLPLHQLTPGLYQVRVAWNGQQVRRKLLVN